MTPTHPGLADGPIYLDYHATTPVDPRVSEAARPYWHTQFGNPSSDHAYGAAPRAAINRARDQVAELLGAAAESVVFTGSGTEADNHAIAGVVAAAGPGAHVITQVTEHPAVLRTCADLARRGLARLTYLPVDSDGLVDPDALAAEITTDTVLVSVMHANNETGVIQPIADLARIAHAHGALLHTDAAQTVGKIDVDVTVLDVDLLTVAGHKVYAPKGVGALYLRPGIRIAALIHGGGQEHRHRAGTENVAGIVALGAAAHLARESVASEQIRLRNLRDRLHRHLDNRLPGRVRLHGHPDRRLPGALNIAIEHITGADLLTATPGIAASTGSACHAGNTTPSPVLTAMGIPTTQALGAIRLTLGRYTTTADIDRAADLITHTARSSDRSNSATAPLP